MGPHGLLVGATGSGKSELLRTLVLALAVTHSPEILNFVLVDFKGGATFAALDRLPHTSAVITNLADELPLVDRMLDAIHGELVRRQELLRRAGNYASQRDYEKARAAGAPLAPLPSLLIIVRRVQRAAVREARLHRHVRADRPGRPVARRAPAAGLAAAGGGAAARPGDPPVLPDRAAHLLRDGVSRVVLGVARRLRAAARARARLPQVRHRAADPVPGGVRLRRCTGGRRRAHASGTGDRLARHPRLRPPATWRRRPSRSRGCRYGRRGRDAIGREPARRAGRAGSRARARRRTRCGCRRWRAADARRAAAAAGGRPRSAA